MQVFSSLARKLMNDEFRQHLLKTQTTHDVKQYLGSQLGIAVAMVGPVSSKANSSWTTVDYLK